MSSRLNDTEALVRQGTRAPQLETAAEGVKVTSWHDDASAATCGHQPGRFQRTTGAGNSSLAEAVNCVKGEQ